MLSKRRTKRSKVDVGRLVSIILLVMLIISTIAYLLIALM